MFVAVTWNRFPLSVPVTFSFLGFEIFLTLASALFLFAQQGFTLLHMACDKGHETIVRMLTEAGADLEVKAKVS